MAITEMPDASRRLLEMLLTPVSPLSPVVTGYINAPANKRIGPETNSFAGGESTQPNPKVTKFRRLWLSGHEFPHCRGSNRFPSFVTQREADVGGRRCGNLLLLLRARREAADEFAVVEQHFRIVLDHFGKVVEETGEIVVGDEVGDWIGLHLEALA